MKNQNRSLESKKVCRTKEQTHLTYIKIHHPHLHWFGALASSTLSSRSGSRSIRNSLFTQNPSALKLTMSHPSPFLLWNDNKREGLCPALLCVNKKVHGEASSLLYSDNHFRFPDIHISKPYDTYSPCIAPFLCQIGSQASLLRHICIDFPTFRDSRRDRAELHEAHIKNLELIRDTCTGLTTLELMFPPPSYGDAPITADELGLLDMRFKAILSPKEVIVNFRVYAVEHRSADWIKMRDRGWTVEVTKVWPSCDNRVYFENGEECAAYDQEQSRLEWEREQEEYKEQWTEEYYRRRDDPYWKNDSDYD